MWTDAELASGEERLAQWRSGVSRVSGPDGRSMLSAVREALYDDLDTPAALAAVDAWCAAEGDDAAAPALVKDVVDALLGVAL
jgi:L-cysteine:1D-myo-inositol 2-amino-2-deoxy-alpha-D-glucopyranoside ligase